MVALKPGAIAAASVYFHTKQERRGGIETANGSLDELLRCEKQERRGGIETKRRIRFSQSSSPVKQERRGGIETPVAM